MTDTPAMSDRPARDFTHGLAAVEASPRALGRLERIVRRPRVDARELVDEASLDPEAGLVGDSWLARGSRSSPDRRADPAAQLTLMSVRVLAAIEPDEARWPLAGDQLLVDLDLHVERLPAGTRLAIGDAIVEVSAKPHTGCAKFAGRFGVDALAWISTPVGKAHRMRGLNARIVRGGTVRVGDAIRRV